MGGGGGGGGGYGITWGGVIMDDVGKLSGNLKTFQQEMSKALWNFNWLYSAMCNGLCTFKTLR